MQRFCFVHAADLHLDTPFEGIRATAPHVTEALRDASLDAFDCLVELCLERGAAFLTVAGDVYDGPERGLRAQLRFRAGLERLSRSGIPVFVVHGNHDPTEEGWSAIRDWPTGTTVFEAGEVQAVPVVRGGERIATVYGTSFGERAVAENLSLGFPRRGVVLAGGGAGETPAQHGLRVGLLHCNAGASSEHAAYSPCTLADLEAAAIDYWALGHVHQHRILARGSETAPWIVYPGNLQGRSPHASERGAKGAVVVEVEAGAVANVEFCALDRVRFLELGLDVSDCADLAVVERALRGAADEMRSAHRDCGLVLCVRLSGRSALHRDLGRPERTADLLTALRDGSRDERPFLWWATLVGDVRRVLDREALRARDDFAGELVALGESLAAAPEKLHRFALEQLAELPDELNGVSVPPLEPEDLAALLARAEESAFACVDVPDGDSADARSLAAGALVDGEGA